MSKFWNWLIEPFNKPQLQLTTVDQFRIAITILVGLIIVIGLVCLVIFILMKIGVIK